jgi:hypothetical protein
MTVLRDYLLKFFPPTHQVMYVTSSVSSNARPVVEAFPLAELGGTKQMPQKIGASLFIPAVRPLTRNEEFLQRMNDADRFEEDFR